MKKEITELVNRLETEINKTSTGELRNLLCDANIMIQALNIGVIPDVNISLRDYVAGQAINGILCNSNLLSKMQGNIEENDLMATRTAYRIADCMLKVSNER